MKQRSPTRVDAAAVFGAGIHGDALAQFAARADDQPGRPAAIMHRLRRRAERRERIDHGAVADRRCAGDVDMGDQAHAACKLDLRPDQAIRPDLHALANARAVGDARGRIDRHLVLGNHGADLGLGDQTRRRPWPRRGTTTCCGGARSCRRDIRWCRPASRACGISLCRW